MKKRSSPRSEDLTVVLDNKNESLESSLPYVDSKAKLIKQQTLFDPKFESSIKIKPKAKKDVYQMPEKLGPSIKIKSQGLPVDKKSAKARQIINQSSRGKSQEPVQIKSHLKKTRLQSATVKNNYNKGVFGAKKSLINQVSKKKPKTNNLMVDIQQNSKSKKEIPFSPQLDLQTESGQALVDKNEIKAAQFGNLVNSRPSRDVSHDNLGFYANYSNSPTSGWGKIIDTKFGFHVQDKPIDTSQNDIHVARTLSGSEGYMSQGQDLSISQFQSNLNVAKKFLYDGGVIQSFCPEKFSSPKDRKVELSQIQNLDELMKNIEEPPENYESTIERQESSAVTEHAQVQNQLIEKSQNYDAIYNQPLSRKVTPKQSTDRKPQAAQGLKTTQISMNRVIDLEVAQRNSTQSQPGEAIHSSSSQHFMSISENQYSEKKRQQALNQGVEMRIQAEREAEEKMELVEKEAEEKRTQAEKEAEENKIKAENEAIQARLNFEKEQRESIEAQKAVENAKRQQASQAEIERLQSIADQERMEADQARRERQEKELESLRIQEEAKAEKERLEREVQQLRERLEQEAEQVRIDQEAERLRLEQEAPIVSLQPFYALQKKDIKLYSEPHFEEFQMPSTPPSVLLPKCTAIFNQLQQVGYLKSEEQFVQDLTPQHNQYTNEEPSQNDQTQKLSKRVSFPDFEQDLMSIQRQTSHTLIQKPLSSSLSRNIMQINQKSSESQAQEVQENEFEDDLSSQDVQYIIATLPVITAVYKKFNFVRYHMVESKNGKDLSHQGSDSSLQISETERRDLVLVQLPSITAMSGSIMKKAFFQDSGFVFESPINPKLSKIDPINPVIGAVQAIGETQSEKESDQLTETRSANMDFEIGASEPYSALNNPASYPQPLLSSNGKSFMPKGAQMSAMKGINPSVSGSEESSIEEMSFRDKNEQLVLLEQFSDQDESSRDFLSSTDSKFIEKKSLVNLLVAQQCKDQRLQFDIDQLTNRQIEKLDVDQFKEVVDCYLKNDNSQLDEFQLQLFDQLENQNLDNSQREEQISIVEHENTYNSVQKVKNAQNMNLYHKTDEIVDDGLSNENGNIFKSEIEGREGSQEREAEYAESFDQSPSMSRRQQNQEMVGNHETFSQEELRPQPTVSIINASIEQPVLNSAANNPAFDAAMSNKILIEDDYQQSENVNQPQVSQVVNPLMIQAEQYAEEQMAQIQKSSKLMKDSELSHNSFASSAEPKSKHLPNDDELEQSKVFKEGEKNEDEVSEKSQAVFIKKSENLNVIMKSANVNNVTLESPKNDSKKKLIESRLLGNLKKPIIQKYSEMLKVTVKEDDQKKIKELKNTELKILDLENGERSNLELGKLKEKCICHNETNETKEIPKDQQQDKESDNENDQEEIDHLSYKKLIKYIEKFHPVHPITKQKFSVWDRITVQDYYSKLWDPFFCHVMFNGCKRFAKKYYKFSRGDTTEERKDRKPPTLQEMPDSGSSTSEDEEECGFMGLTAAGAHLGVGAILYLQTMKTMTMLFFVLTILNLPVYFLYSQTTQNNQYGDLDIAFQYFTFGNFGGKLEMCSSTEINFSDPQPSFNLQCDRDYHHMKEIAFYGFLYDKDIRMANNKSSGTSQCEQISDKDYGKFPIEGSRLLLEDVQTITTQESASESITLAKNNTFNNLDTLCQSNSKMLFSDDEARGQFEKYFQDNCYNKDNCKWDFDAMEPRPFRSLISQFCQDRIIQQPGGSDPITSNQFIFVVKCQGSTYKIQSLELHKQQIACICVITDILSITIMIYVFKRLQSMNALFIDRVDANQITMKDFSVQVNNTVLDKYTQDIRLVKMKIWLHFTRRFREFKLLDNDYEVCDVILSLSNQPETLQIFKMEEIQGEINTIKSKLATNEYVEAMYFQKQEELEDLKDQYERQKDRYKQIIDDQRKARQNLGIVHASHRIKMIDYIFVTFKNVECVEQVVETMQKEPEVSKLVRCIFCIKNKKVTQKEFLKQEMDVEEAIEPDEILWESLKQENHKRGGKIALIYLIAFLFIIGSCAIQIVLEGLRYEVNQRDSPQLCPGQDKSLIIAEDAWKDIKSVQPQGLMNCFCIQEYKLNVMVPWKIALKTFEDSDPDQEDKTKYCLPWFKRSVTYMTIRIVSAFSIPILNAVISRTFKSLGQYQMMHTTIETTLNSFVRITFLEFLNTGFLMIFISLSGTNKLFLHYQDFQIKPDKLGYEGFDYDWYFDVGRVITVSVFISCFIANLFDLRHFVKYYFRQSSDRKFAQNIKKFPTDEDDDQPNTIMHIQEDLQNLYTGQDFQCETTLSRMMSITITVLVFSSGMPILYFIGFVFYILTFMVNKLLIMQYYRRTDSILSREIPQFSVTILYYAIIAKMLMGLVMITNPSIIETRDEPTKEQIPFYFDIKAMVENLEEQANQGVNKRQLNVGSQMDQFSDYFQYLHQQIYIIFVFGSFLAYLVITYGLLFAKLIYQGTIGTVIKLFLKIWYLIKFVITLIYVKLSQLDRLRKRQQKKAAQKLKLAASNSVNLQLNSSMKRAFTKDFKNVEEALDKGENESKSLFPVKKNENSKEKSKDDDQENSSCLESDDHDRKSAISSVNAANAVEEATKKMMELAALAYEEKKIKMRDSRFDYSDNFYKELNIISLSFIYQASLKDLEDFKALFKINHGTERFIFESQIGKKVLNKVHVLRENFLELCYMNNINEEDVREYEILQEKRIMTIRNVIDDHFELIKKTIIEEAEEKKEREIEKTYAKEDYRQKIEQRIIEHKYIKNKDIQFKGNDDYYTYEKKLEQLMDHQDALIRNEKDHINNRRHLQRICRMKGSIAQSYFIFDNPQYKVARKIYYGLYEEEKEIREQQENDDENEYQDEDSQESDHSQSNFPISRIVSAEMDKTKDIDGSQNNLLQTDHSVAEINEMDKIEIKVNKKRNKK